MSSVTDRYQVSRRLARGGMGVVDLAVGPDGTEVALKRLALHGTADEMRAARTRFERELRVLQELTHDAVVPLLDVVDDGGEIVLVMPYFAGGNLAERVREHGPLSPGEVERMGRRLLPGLAAAHRRGIVHRDIKPANVLFDAEGRAHLADFGVASTRDATDGLTRTGTVLGTPGFVAPEQARGEPASAASDIAALGATLHFAATGHSPYGDGDAHAVLLRAARGRSRIDRDLPPKLRRTLRTMLESRPDRRPAAAALVGGADDTHAIPLDAPWRLRRWRWAIAGLVAVGLAGGAAVALVRGDAEGGGSLADVAAAVPTTEPCRPLDYQPCGQEPAPNTDGERCLDGFADYDGRARTGCEAVADDVDGQLLEETLEATIVPAGDVDRYPLRVVDEADLGCSNTLRVTINAPEGMTLRLEITDDDGDVLDEAVAADGVPGEVAIRDPRCFQNDTGDYTAVVTPVGSDRSAEPYTLTRTGSF